MALAVGKTGLVIALEPNPYVYKILSKNAGLNTTHTSIHPLCFAATDQDGVFVFNYSDASFCNGGFLSQLKNQRHNHHYQLNVEGKNFQNYLLKHYSERLPDLGLIKIDAEGYDKEILKTIPLLLSTYRPKLIIECYKNLSQAERNELFDVVHQHGYELFYLADFEKDSTRVPINRHNMSDRRHFNILAIHSALPN
jgi:FkbM family methyltransferase